METYIDQTGTAYEAIPQGESKIVLRSKKFPEITHVYKKAFLDNAVAGGLLTKIEPGQQIEISWPEEGQGGMS